MERRGLYGLDITVHSPPSSVVGTDDRHVLFDQMNNSDIHENSQYDDVTPGQDVVLQPEVSDCDSVFTIDEEDIQVLEEYRSIVSWYRELPRDMCIAQIIQNFGSSEYDLERVRDYYFEHLKKTCENFPYSRDATLKRRIFIRGGDPVFLRLAQDLYCIVDVTEGGDPSSLKSMISTGRKTKRASIVCSKRGRSRSRHSSVVERTSDKCACSSEVKLLKDTVSSLQADILLMKQTMHAAEKIRREQHEIIKASVLDIKQQFLKFGDNVRDCSVSSLSSFKNISNSVMQQLISFEDRVRLLEAAVELHCSDSYVQPNAVSSVENCDRLESPYEFYATVLQDPNPTHQGSAQHCMASAHTIFGQEVPLDKVKRNSYQHSDSDQVKGAPIPVRITDRPDVDMLNNSRRAADPDGFHTQRRRGTKHHCVLGLSRSVDVNILSSVIQTKGPTVTNVRVFPCKRNSDKVVLRLNLKADEYCDRVLEDGFWPHYASCRPWRPWSRRQRGQRDMPPRFRQDRRTSAASSDCLISDVD